MKCPNCGREGTGSIERCTACGTILTGALNTGVFPSDGDSPTFMGTSVATGTFPSPGGFIPPPPEASVGAHGPLHPGESFGARYHIIRLLGMGGMGAVYQAWDSELGVAVAIKVVLPDADPEAAADVQRRFKRELLLARQVTHKNVVRIHDLGEIDGIKYITMSFVEGDDLANLLRKEGRIPVPRALKIARHIVDGLVAAHSEGIVHRDLKPANIMIDASGDAVIMDFGIARSTNRVLGLQPGAGGRGVSGTRGALHLNRTMVGTVVGTIPYMAPEQAGGQEVDQRADIYSFGLILYDMLAGDVRGRSSPSAIEELKARTLQVPASPRSFVPEIPEALDRVITRCLAPNPDDRYKTTADLAADLAKLDEKGEPLPFRRVVGARVVAAGGVAALVLLGLTWWFGGRATPVVEHAPISVVIADFENRTGDPLFQGTLENALGIALEGASFITAYRREDARNAIKLIKPDATLDEAGARLLSAREGIKVILAGAIEPAGSGYVITARAIDPAATAPLASVTQRASSKDDVLRTVGSLASEIREGLGDETPESARLSAAETVTAASLEALQNYTKGQDLQINSRYEDSIAYYRRAIALDPKFGRAYASLAVSANSLGRRDEAEALYKQAFALMDRMTEREKYRTYGTYYLTIAGNYEQAIDNYSTLLKLYPADRAARTNLAYAYFATLNFARALEENRQAMDIYQGSYKLWSNHSLYAMYASDFKTAETEAARVLEQSPTAYRAYLPRAMASLSRSDLAGARDAYSRMAAIDKQGDSLATMGLADVLMYEGSFPAAADILRKGADADDQLKSPSAAAAKAIALAEALDAQGQPRQAAAAVERALKTSRGLPTLVAAARMHVRLGNVTAAQDLVAELEKRLQPQPRSYAKIIEGEIAIRSRKPAEAIEAFSSAIKLADLWLARFALGVAYVQADHWAEGLRELEACEKRKGEATALFLDDVPTYRHLAPLPYWLARAQEGLGQTSAAVENYKKFLALTPAASRDSLVLDARRRLQSLATP